ncbi:MAG TPA: hypothetical protein PLA94_22760, partial [Myxococcota bacterium]|nr:hypothetical protein [Myxococcota bacterium]
MFLILLAACGVEKEALDSPVEEVVDYRLTDLPEAPAGGLTLWGPEVEIEPYSDKMFCYYVDYPGDDAGIHSYDVYQGPVGHHMVLFRSTAGQADGSLEDCTDLSGQTMTMVEPILFAPTFGPGENLLTFPEGMGAAVRSGDKLMIQAHYLNTSDKPALVKDAINLGLIPEADVTTSGAIAVPAKDV